MSNDDKTKTDEKGAAGAEGAAPTQIPTDDWDIGYLDGGAIMLITIPLRKWAYEKNGDLLTAGAMYKARAIALRNLKIILDDDKRKGIIKPHAGLDIVQ